MFCPWHMHISIYIYKYIIIYPVYPCFFFSICPSRMPKKEINESSMQEICAELFQPQIWKENPSTSIHRIIPPPSAKSGNSLKNPACKEAGPPDKPAVPLNPRLSDGFVIVVPRLHGYTILSHLLKKTVEHGLTKYPISVLVIWPFVMALDITCAMLTTCSMFSVQGHPILIRWWHFFLGLKIRELYVIFIHFPQNPMRISSHFHTKWI